MVSPGRSWPRSRCPQWLHLRVNPRERATWPLAFYHISNSCSISSRAVVKSFTWLLHKVCCSRNWALSSSFIFNFTFKACLERHSKRENTKQNFGTLCFYYTEDHRSTAIRSICPGFRDCPLLLEIPLTQLEQWNLLGFGVACHDSSRQPRAVPRRWVSWDWFPWGVPCPRHGFHTGLSSEQPSGLRSASCPADMNNSAQNRIFFSRTEKEN